MPYKSSPQRIAVLGGGVAALTAAFTLAKLNEPGKPKRFSITVYQQGWRLGGKGASGRNAELGQRIEEHGLHVWFGAYENAFRLIREVYGATPGKWPWGDLSRAFREQYGFHLGEELGRGWKLWRLSMPHRQRSSPGDGTPQGPCTPRRVLSRLGFGLADQYDTGLYQAVLAMAKLQASGDLEEISPPIPTPAYLRSLASRLDALVEETDPEERAAIAAEYGEVRRSLAHHFAALQELALFGRKAKALKDSAIDGWRHAWIIVAVGTAVIAGTLRSPAYTRDDWDELNEFDLRDWLRCQLGTESALADSALIEASYDLYFSYPKGDTLHGNLEAGSMLRAAVWLLLEYKGAFMWRMQSAMGDTIFAPLFNALVAMDVEFKFFHKVVKLNTDGSKITRVQMERQASVKAGIAKYAPFITDRLGCDCWPSRPDFAQLDEGGALEAGWATCNLLESDWSSWNAGLPDVNLAIGTDFDHIVLGIPIGTLKKTCGDLVKFQTMLAKVETVQTQALQLWVNRPLAWLQGPSGYFDEPPVLTTFQNPIDTYADMSHLIDKEGWPSKHIAYFCGVLEDQSRGNPTSDPSYPRTAQAHVHEQSIGLFESPAGKPMYSAPMKSLWPAAFQGGTMDWSLLCASTASGPDRLKDQFFHANIDASDRYVLTTAGSSQYRLKCGQSGYDNLFLAGDWTYNGLFVGCIEGAVIAGKQAARALSGEPIEVVGEGTLFKRP